MSLQQQSGAHVVSSSHCSLAVPLMVVVMLPSSAALNSVVLPQPAVTQKRGHLNVPAAAKWTTFGVLMILLFSCASVDRCCQALQPLTVRYCCSLHAIGTCSEAKHMWWAHQLFAVQLCL